MNRALPFLLACVTLASSAPRAAAAGQVNVYRCTGAHGQVTLRDTPCLKGETQQERTMLRPKDPPRPAVVAPVPVRAAPVVRETITRVVQAPRPIYTCTTPDGATYTSESPEGNLRWVPLWTLGYPVIRRGMHRGGGLGGGTWVRDSCTPLPQDQVCDMLSSRRAGLRRRNVALQATERAQLDAEEAVLDARLRDDCGL